MVERFLNLFQRRFSGLHEAAFLLGLSAFGSQILALIRDRLLASSFGAGADLDIYYAAFRLPDLLYVSLGSLVSVTAVLPFLLRHFERGDYPSARRLLADLFRWFLILMLVAMALAYVFMPRLLGFIAPGFSPTAGAELLTLSRILLLSPFLLGLSNLLANLTQAARQFFLYALSPLLYNLGIIIGVVFAWPRWGLPGLVLGVVLGAFLHLAIQLPTLVKNKVRPCQMARSHLDSACAAGEWRKIFLLAWPRALALSVQQLAILILLALASYLAAGSIAVFNFAYNLQAVLLSVIGVSYSVAAFPTLIRLFTNGDRKQFVDQTATAIRHIVFWSLPAVALFIVLRAQIVRVILGAGKFDWADTRLTAAALAIFLVSAAAQGLILLFVRGYYAAGRTKKPLLINLLSSVVVVVLALGFLRLADTTTFFGQWLGQALRVADLAGTELLVLPLAFTLGMLVNLGIFWRSFRRDFGSFPPALYRSFWQSAAAALLAAAASYLLLQILAPFVDQSTGRGIFLQGFLAGLGGIVTGWFVSRWLGNEELREISRALKQKFWRRAAPVLPPAGEL